MLPLVYTLYFEAKYIDGVVTEIEISMSKLELSSSSESERENIETDWLAHLLAIHKELEEHDSTLSLFNSGDFLDQNS